MNEAKAFPLAAIGLTGLLVLLTYYWLYTRVGTPRTGTFEWWFHPFPTVYVVQWAAYACTTVVAYCVAVGWMVADNDIGADVLWAVVAFNVCAAMWVPATQRDFNSATTMFSFMSVTATMIACAVWTHLVNSGGNSPGVYNIAFVALNIQHAVVDWLVWGFGRVSCSNR